MSAVVEATVPDLFQHVGSDLFAMDVDGTSDGERVSVYSSWKRDSARPPHTYITMSSNSFSLGLHLGPDAARLLAIELLRAADLADAHQCALDAEKQTLQEGA